MTHSIATLRAALGQVHHPTAGAGGPPPQHAIGEQHMARVVQHLQTIAAATSLTANHPRPRPT